MPQGDGTGPQGQGPKSRKGSGKCNPRNKNRASQDQSSRGQGRGAGKGAGRGQDRGQGAGQGRGKQS